MQQALVVALGKAAEKRVRTVCEGIAVPTDLIYGIPSVQHTSREPGKKAQADGRYEGMDEKSAVEMVRP